MASCVVATPTSAVPCAGVYIAPMWDQRRLVYADFAEMATSMDKDSC